MFAHMRVRSAGSGRWGTASCPGRFTVPLALAVCGIIMQGCANPPPSPDAARNAADPEARAPSADYRPATSPYISRRPVDPKAWREPDAPVAPQKP